MQAATADAVLSAIAQSQNEVTQGWMRLMASSPWLAELQKNGGALQAEYYDKQLRLWSALLAGRSENVVDAPADRRFMAKEWRDNAYYDYLRQSYFLVSRYFEQLVDAAPLDETSRDRARFAVRQWVDAMCPANFAATNPAALSEAIATHGESMTRGLANLLGDAQKGRISQTDESAFEV